MLLARASAKSRDDSQIWGRLTFNPQNEFHNAQRAHQIPTAVVDFF
jgi:hypothetical protein